jgi:hypothetical protein
MPETVGRAALLPQRATSLLAAILVFSSSTSSAVEVQDSSLFHIGGARPDFAGHACVNPDAQLRKWLPEKPPTRWRLHRPTHLVLVRA